MKKETELIPHIQGLVKIDKTKDDGAVYTLDDLLQVWYFSMLHGATLWQYCQDTKKVLPDDFNKGLEGLRQRVKTSHELQEVLKSRALMVGLFDELVSSNTIITTTGENTSE